MKSFNKIIKSILSKEPELTATGVGTKYQYESDPIPEDEFYLCLKWLDEQVITKKINKLSTSYTYKHDVEAWHEDEFGYHKYISNGSMIAAIIYKGVNYKKFPGSPNITAAIKVIKKEKKHAWPSYLTFAVS